MDYELSISYSRKDNTPRPPDVTRGWVTALRDEIIADHRRVSTEPLRIFFDTEAIAPARTCSASIERRTCPRLRGRGTYGDLSGKPK